MERALGNQKNTEIDISDPEWMDIRNKLHRFYLESVNDVSVLSVVSVDAFTALQSRDRQLWMPIYVMAGYFEDRGLEDLKQKIEDYALHARDQRIMDDSETPEVMLVRALSELVKESGWFTPTAIRGEFVRQCDKDDDTSWVNNKVIGRMLKRIGCTKKRRQSTTREYYITIEAVKKLLERYDITRKATTQTTETTQMALLSEEKPLIQTLPKSIAERFTRGYEGKIFKMKSITHPRNGEGGYISPDNGKHGKDGKEEGYQNAR